MQWAGWLARLTPKIVGWNTQAAILGVFFLLTVFYFVLYFGMKTVNRIMWRIKARYQLWRKAKEVCWGIGGVGRLQRWLSRWDKTNERCWHILNGGKPTLARFNRFMKHVKKINNLLTPELNKDIEKNFSYEIYETRELTKESK